MTRPGVVLALVAALAVGTVTGCSSPTPTEVVAAAFDRTLSDELSYRLTASADRDALAALADDAGPVAAALNGFALLGHRDEGGAQVALQVLGGVSVLELVTLADDRVFVRTDVQGIVGDDLDRLVDDLGAAGASDDVVQGVRALFARQWVGVEGDAGLDGLLDDVLPDVDGSDDATADGTDADAGLDLDLLADLATSAADVGAGTDVPGGGRRHTIAFDPAEVELGLDLAGDAVGDVPVLGGLVRGLSAGAVTGDVVVADGVVTVVTLRLEAGAVDAGRLELVLALDDHGDAPPVTVPQDATIVPAADLAEALVALLAGAQAG